MTNKNSNKDQTITPAGEVELSEEELDQASGGQVIIDIKTGYKLDDISKDGGSTGLKWEKK